MKGASSNKKVEGVSKSRSSSSSIMDDAGPPSLFALVCYFDIPTPYYSILQLDHEYTPEEMIKTKVDEKVRFNIPRPRYPVGRLEPWSFSPVESSTEDLYMVPNWKFSHRYNTVKPVHGYKFNFSNGNFLPIKLPKHYKLNGHLVNVSGHIYFFSHDWFGDTLSVFQCFDPDRESWTDLKPFPDSADRGRIVATAVWNDSILLNVESCRGSCSMWAYDVKVKEWCLVDVEDTQCKRIVGKGVVLGNTIYALTESSVLAFSIKKEVKLDGPLVFKCSLLSGHPLDPILKRDDSVWIRTRHLVHLGKDEFCVVQSCNHTNGYVGQPIQVTHIKIEIERDYSVIVMDEYFHQVVRAFHNQNMDFHVVLCFSLPKGATTALKEFKSFDLDSFEPIPGKEVEEEDVKLDNDSSQTDSIDEQGLYAYELPVNTTAYVRNLPPKATVRQLEKQLEKGLTKFGPIKSGGIRVVTNKRGRHVAYVEFESWSSLQCAIEASPIRIGDCQAEITERGLTELNPADCNRTQAVGSAVPLDNDSSQTSIIDEQGHSIYVRNLPPNATVGQLERGLKKFGRIKRDGSRVGTNKHGKVFACVEFESVTSKQRAIKASSIRIEGYTADILEKGSTGASLQVVC